MKKHGEFDFDTECDFSTLPPKFSREYIKTICIYEYMRESRALTNALSEPSIAPYLNNLYCSCKTNCVREYHLQKKRAGTAIEYQIYCAHCENGVPLPSTAGDHWERQFDEYCSAGLMRPSFAREFNWDATYRLVLALRQAGFPKPWKILKDDAQQELIRVIANWDEEHKKTYPPVVIELGFERDFEREQQQGARFPIWRFKSFEPELHRWQWSRRKYFCGLIWIDEGYNETEAVEAFTNEFRKRWPKTAGGGGPNWRARLNQLAVMRIWKQERDQWERLKLVARFCLYKGCVEELAAYKERCKQGHANEPMSEAAKVEVSGARARARDYFQSLFRGEEPLSYRVCEDEKS